MQSKGTETAVENPSSQAQEELPSSALRESSGFTEEQASTPHNPLTKDQIIKGLYNLNRTADGQSLAYLNLRIAGHWMPSTELLRTYEHLQVLSLRNNMIQDVSDLGHLRHLVDLDLSHNKLTIALDIYPPLLNLRKVDLSSNEIEKAHDLGSFSRLERLILDKNHVHSLDGVSQLHFLTHLSLKENKLTDCCGLERMRALRSLYLDNNGISSLRPLFQIKSLEVLMASNNQLQDLEGIEEMQRLHSIDISYNIIQTLEDIYFASDATFLNDFASLGNPMEQALHSRLHTIHLLPQITVLNGRKVSAKEKVLASNLHGANVDAQKLVRKKWFPVCELDDGGGAIPPTAAGMEALDGCRELPMDIGETNARVVLATEKYSGGGIAELAQLLCYECSDEVMTCMRIWYWIVSHLNPPQTTWQAEGDLFRACDLYLERIASDIRGMWSERATGFFVELLRACGLVAVSVSGYCKTNQLWPGQRLLSHNHCWSAVNLNKRWLLLDVTWAAEMHGTTPFFVSPSVFIYRCFPLEAHWQLLPSPMDLCTFWGLPMCSIMFLHRGLSVVNTCMTDVHQLAPSREGDPTPTLCVGICGPKKCMLKHYLLDSNFNAVSEDCDALFFSKASNILVELRFRSCKHCGKRVYKPSTFEQHSCPCNVENDMCVMMKVEGLSESESQVQELWTAFPTYGVFYVVVDVLEELTNPFSLRIEETTMVLDIRETYQGLKLKVVVPQPEPLDAERGLSESPFTRIVFQESDPTVIAAGCKLFELVNQSLSRTPSCTPVR